MLDVVFARYAGKRAVTGAYLFVVGGIFFAGQGAVLALARLPLAFDTRAAAWGISAGAVLMLANALLVESLARINVSLGSTIYRLNTIAVVVYAIAFLHETFTGFKAAGVLLGVAAVALLYQSGGRAGDNRLLAGVWLVVAASLLRAAFGILSKIGLTDGAEPFVFLTYVGAGWTLAAAAYGLVRGGRRAATRDVLVYGAVCGSLVCVVASFLLLGLRAAEASIVIPIANMSFVVALLTSAALGMERLTRRKFLAVAAAAAAIVLLTRA